MGDTKEGVITIAVVFMVLPVIATSLRVWARSMTRAKLALDDYLLFAATVRLS